MSKVQTLRSFINQRLSAAAEEIFELFETTIAEYEEELCRQRKLLGAGLKPDVQIHPADEQPPLVRTEGDPPEQQDWSPTTLDQEAPPELPHIKEEQEELWTSQEEKQLGGLVEADVTKFTFASVPMKSEEDEDKPQSSQLRQKQTEHNRNAEHLKREGDGEDCGEPEPASIFNPDSHLQSDTYVKMPLSSETDTDESHCEWEENGELQSGLNCLQNNEVLVSHIEKNTRISLVGSSECSTSFGHKGHRQKHSAIQTGPKPFSCSVCGNRYKWKKTLMTHMRIHSEGKRFSCPVCKKTFQWRGNVVTHMRIHTGEKPFSCSVCGKGFSQKEHLRQHMRIHTGEKPFVCSVCGKGFTQASNLTSHLRVHTRDKSFTCSVCKASFTVRRKLSLHMRMHNVPF